MKRKKRTSCLSKIFNFLTVIVFTSVLLYAMQNYDKAFATLKFAQVSDVHFSTETVNKSYRLTAQSREIFSDVIDKINSTPNLDFVMFSGDMINKPFEKELLAFLPYANKLRYPWYVALGNHDICIGGFLTKGMYLKIIKESNKNFDFEHFYYSFVPKKGFKVIALDSTIDTRITANGEISQVQLNWLKAELANTQNATVLIFLHVPLVEPFESPSHQLLNASEVLSILEESNLPIAVFSGHYHSTAMKVKNNILHVNTPSLISYPIAFRTAKVRNYRDKVVFDIKLVETGLTELQTKAKLMVLSGATYYGNESDRNYTYEIEKR